MSTLAVTARRRPKTSSTFISPHFPQLLYPATCNRRNKAKRSGDDDRRHDGRRLCVALAGRYYQLGEWIPAVRWCTTLSANGECWRVPSKRLSNYAYAGLAVAPQPQQDWMSRLSAALLLYVCMLNSDSNKSFCFH